MIRATPEGAKFGFDIEAYLRDHARALNQRVLEDEVYERITAPVPSGPVKLVRFVSRFRSS